MKQALRLSNIADLDSGRVEAAFNQALKTAVQDCMDRPGDTSARKVNLVLTIKPEKAAEGICEDIDVEFQIQAKLPTKRSKTYRMQPHATGGAIFNPASDDQPRQHTLDEAAE